MIRYRWPAARRAADGGSARPGEQLAGMAAVDVADEGRADVVAQEFLQSRGQGRHRGRRYGEDVVFYWAQPASRVVQHDAEPVRSRGVGAATVPDAAGVDQRATRCHLDDPDR